MGLSREERQAIQATIPPADLRRFRRDLEKLDKKTWRGYYRKATRKSQKIHILPFIRTATPDGSGKKAYGKKSLAASGLRKPGGTNLSAGTYRMKRSTGKLRRSFKIRAMKRSRKITGMNTVNYSKTIFYGRLLEMGRTFNEFKNKRDWARVPKAAKGKGNRLWIPGRWMWLSTANRRKTIAERAVVRYVDSMIARDDKANKLEAKQK